MGAYTAFLDVALGLANPALGLIAGGVGLAAVFLFLSMAGFIVANSIEGALANFPGRAGAVSALVGAIHYGSGIIGSALVGAFADGTPWSLGWVVTLAGRGAAACAWCLVPTRARSVTAG